MRTTSLSRDLTCCMFTLVYCVQLLFQKVPFNLYSVLQCLLARQCSFLFCCWCSYKHTIIIVPGRFGGCSGSYRSVHQWCSSYSPAAHCWSHAHLQAQNVSHNASSVHLKNEMIRTLKSRCPATHMFEYFDILSSSAEGMKIPTRNLSLLLGWVGKMANT